MTPVRAGELALEAKGYSATDITKFHTMRLIFERAAVAQSIKNKELRK